MPDSISISTPKCSVNGHHCGCRYEYDCNFVYFHRISWASIFNDIKWIKSDFKVIKCIGFVVIETEQLHNRTIAVPMVLWFWFVAAIVWTFDFSTYNMYIEKKAAPMQTASNESIVIKNCCEWALNYGFIFYFLIRTVFLCFQFNFASFGWDSFYRKHLWCCLGANECLFALSGLISFHSTKVFGIVFLLLFSTNNYFQFHIHHTVSESQSLSLSLFIHPHMKRSILHFHSSILFIHPFIHSPWTSRMCKSHFATRCVCASVIVSVCI